MELTEEFISGLAVDEERLIKDVAGAVAVGGEQAAAVVALFAEGCTVPFISRYRKEKTGGLDEVQ
ncbi:MAG: hypothetical protein FWC24_05530, partial [Treponema sp.]|nr:hypothetical protein [Treponema sp.]